MQERSRAQFCDERTLHIVISYSGNTKEILEAFERSRGRKICITGGGALAEKCKDVIKVPEGFLPRQALFYMLIPAIGLFYDLPPEIPEWLEETKEQRNNARIMAKRIGERTPLIYGSYPFSSLALRFKQQVNENCKTRAFCNYFPELNHNEIESFHNNFRDYAVISINGQEKSLNIMRESCDVLKMELYGKNDVERLFKALYFIDFVTYYLAELKGVDPAAMPNIDLLKS
jgi:glucose/mannose-6-phosphate isomerase